MPLALLMEPGLAHDPVWSAFGPVPVDYTSRILASTDDDPEDDDDQDDRETWAISEIELSI